MSFHVTLDSLEEIHTCLMQELLENPDCESAPRGKPIKELIAASFTLMNPRNRLIMSPARNVNYGFAVGELCWYVRGDSDLETMVYYNKRMAQFSDDSVTINSAYGSRIFKEHWFGSSTAEGGENQFDNVIRELKSDPDSRRAVIHINMPLDLRKAVVFGSKDVPCTMSLQLLIRNRKLHMHVLMRSNDVVWGMPYDVFSFTCLQEAFLYRLQEAGVPVDDLGSYHHTAGSLHLYETHYDMAGLVIMERNDRPTPMLPFTLGALESLAEQTEPDIRAGQSTGGGGGVTTEWMAEQLFRHYQKRETEKLNKEIK